MKLAIGAVQFGLDYGISNRQGQTPQDEVKKILQKSTAEGITVLDTAYGYGESEKVLGHLSSELKAYSVITKIPDLEKTNLSIPEIFDSSLSRLGIKQAYGLLFHNPDNLLVTNGTKNYQAILALKESGKIKKLGVSVYSVEQLKNIVSRYKIDIVQLPLNIFDQRFLKNNLLDSLKDIGIEIHVRSIFLQGLLLMNLSDIPSYFEKMKPHLQFFQDQLKKSEISALEACMGFVKNINEIDRIVVGVNNLAQLEQLIALYKSTKTPILDCDKLSFSDEHLLMPINWKLK